MKKQMKIAQPLRLVCLSSRRAEAELYDDVYGGDQLLLGARRTPSRPRRSTWRPTEKKFNVPPGDYGALRVQRRSWRSRAACELAKSTDSEAVADALRKNPIYDHYKGKQWWRTCDNKSFQDLWILQGPGAGEGQGRLGLRGRRGEDPGQRGAGPHLQGEGARLARARRLSHAPSPGLHRPGAGDDLRPAGHRPVADLRADDGGELRPRRPLHAGGVLRRVPARATPRASGWR